MNAKKTLTALIFGISGAATAATEQPGFYVGTSLGEAEANHASEFGLTDDTHTAFRIFGGYEFSNLLTAEVGYLDFGHYNGSLVGTGGPASTRVGLDGFSIGLRPQIALTGDWFVQGQLGVFLWDANATVTTSFGRVEEKSDGENAYYGLGIGRKFGSSWRVAAEWTRYETDESDVDFINLAMTYRIGK